MLSAKKEILYIGKAKNIPNRLKSYVLILIYQLELKECYLLQSI